MQIETFLKQQGVEYEKHTHPTTYTAQGLAHAEHVSGYTVAKPVIVKEASGFAMCVLPAPKHLDRKRAARVFNDPDVRLATELEMIDLFPGCELGAEPPIGPMFGMKTIIDSRLHDGEYVIMQAGTHRESIRVRREDWERACNATVAPIAQA